MSFDRITHELVLDGGVISDFIAITAKLCKARTDRSSSSSHYTGLACFMHIDQILTGRFSPSVYHGTPTKTQRWFCMFRRSPVCQGFLCFRKETEIRVNGSELPKALPMWKNWGQNCGRISEQALKFLNAQEIKLRQVFPTQFAPTTICYLEVQLLQNENFLLWRTDPFWEGGGFNIF